MEVYSPTFPCFIGCSLNFFSRLRLLTQTVSRSVLLVYSLFVECFAKIQLAFPQTSRHFS